MKENIFLVKNKDVKNEEVKSIESSSVKGQFFIKPLKQTRNQLMIQVTMSSGIVVPEHIHDHESIIYIIEGAVESIIDGNSYIAKPGDVVYHPEGVPHSTHALEKSIFIEIKSPPKKTW
ncbi:MAG: cupin domain-containing protein [Candidatus Hodarchaeota archaeon]